MCNNRRVTREEIEDHIRAVVDEFDGIVSMYLFGSYAEAREHAESDVDVGVLLDRERYPTEDERFDLRLRLSTALSFYGGPLADIVILNDAPATLGSAIVTRGTRLVCLDEEKDQAWVRDVLLQAPDLERWLERMRAITLEALGRQ